MKWGEGQVGSAVSSSLELTRILNSFPLVLAKEFVNLHIYSRLRFSNMKMKRRGSRAQTCSMTGRLILRRWSANRATPLRSGRRRPYERDAEGRDKKSANKKMRDSKNATENQGACNIGQPKKARHGKGAILEAEQLPSSRSSTRLRKHPLLAPAQATTEIRAQPHSSDRCVGARSAHHAGEASRWREKRKRISAWCAQCSRAICLWSGRKQIKKRACWPPPTRRLHSAVTYPGY